ncbi:Peptidyl-prolyl cis-trans isomerase D [Raoultella terrigena]|uniref:Peptidyl-prolyl cis-trans isomerase D n=1 Tax=Raoultella terrigena TaxID=577 RepID=A0A4U9DEQ2_RAOTE|nr:Peptidyl-prolyl cis-trans isomerase D [Raoultella terrigena]
MTRKLVASQFENAVASERNRMQQQLGDQFSELAANENYMKNHAPAGAEPPDRRIAT